MTIANLLREQILELHKLLDLKNKRIAELETMLAAPRPIVNLPFIQTQLVPPRIVTGETIVSDPVTSIGSVWFDKNGVPTK